jgi:hypothetical protein
LAFAGQLDHTKRPFDVDANGIIKTRIEVDAGCAINNNLAVFAEFLEVYT